MGGCVTPIEAHTPVKIIKLTQNKTPGHILSNNALCLRSSAQYMLLFLVLAGNFKFMELYTLILKLVILMHSC